MQVIAENPGLVTGVDFAGEILLFGHEAQQLLEGHLLHRLRRGTVELPGDAIPLRVGVDSEFDRVVGFGSFCFVVSHHACQVGGFHPRLTTHVI
ncbi:MAG: hypothetical protein ACR2RV_27205 [Verrucomicrobiales bacterium]